jgi:hypothetical protein
MKNRKSVTENEKRRVMLGWFQNKAVDGLDNVIWVAYAAL